MVKNQWKQMWWKSGWTGTGKGGITLERFIQSQEEEGWKVVSATCEGGDVWILFKKETSS